MQFELTKEFIDDIILALEKEDSGYIVEAINPLHPADIAEILEIILVFSLDLHNRYDLFFS